MEKREDGVVIFTQNIDGSPNPFFIPYAVLGEKPTEDLKKAAVSFVDMEAVVKIKEDGNFELTPVRTSVVNLKAQEESKSKEELS